jgi:hypothetical protein
MPSNFEFLEMIALVDFVIINKENKTQNTKE